MDTAKAVDSGHAFPSVASGFIPSIVASVCIEGCDTDISIMEFTDKLFIVVSQYKKLGTLFSVYSPFDGFSDWLTSFIDSPWSHICLLGAVFVLAVYHVTCVNGGISEKAPAH
ncbi:hypothetical protein HPB52_010566 [Rhipicephalus sanguineus]|uniref:Uncharacterized protein n=1 Tax=Rhipicephalus sanguineus TaxID=34632 RepID=A0A9D4PCI7_RHISA|nr:hypothetical protein HPB52_010566 [Rhipicephalus sanguineus]